MSAAAAGGRGLGRHPRAPNARDYGGARWRGRDAAERGGAASAGGTESVRPHPPPRPGPLCEVDWGSRALAAVPPSSSARPCSSVYSRRRHARDVSTDALEDVCGGSADF
eukprot:scaffold2737_cov218-Prasinococcus_capsulatus_cf.AAC.3